MILKKADDRSDDIAVLKGLRQASPAAFHAIILKQIDNIHAGVSGERQAAHFLEREFGRNENTAILHDLRLGVDEDFAQIDHLLIHRVRQTAWVLETKNYSGRLSCDDHGDWTVWKNGKPTPVPSPINQARRQCDILRRWLDLAGIQTIRQIHPVVLISPTSSVNRTKLPPGTHVVKSDNIGTWWEKQAGQIGVGTALGMFGRHLLNGMSRDDLVALGERLARGHVPPTYDWRAMLKLPHPKKPVGASRVEPTRGRADGALAEGAGVPSRVSTPHGDITIHRIPDGRYALRNGKNEALIRLVQTACKGKGQWSPRFRNWLVGEAQLGGILAAISGRPNSDGLTRSVERE
jgi:hypothetical protein